MTSAQQKPPGSLQKQKEKFYNNYNNRVHRIYALCSLHVTHVPKYLILSPKCYLYFPLIISDISGLL